MCSPVEHNGHFYLYFFISKIEDGRFRRLSFQAPSMSGSGIICMGGSSWGGGTGVPDPPPPPGIARLLIFAMLKFSVRPLLGILTAPSPPEKISGSAHDLHSCKVLCWTLFCAYNLDFPLVAPSPGSPMFSLHSLYTITEKNKHTATN